MASLGKIGGALALSLGALGSTLGVGAAGPAAVGSWKKCFAQEKPAPFVLVTFVGAPLSQTIYGMILMNQILAKCTLQAGQTAEQYAAAVSNWPAMLVIGLFGGAAIGLSAWFQGIIGASASDAMAETGKGFGNYLMALGIVETVALFVMVFIGGLV
ncbi:MAG: V-type ATP synthase subunit K [Planctomycetes bacterium]|nr:V-type ATP synthase subunit K [Planctomycetota bacterium]